VILDRNASGIAEMGLSGSGLNHDARTSTARLELCVFLGRTLKAPQVRRVDRASKSKVFHIIHIRHRDEVEAPITDWLQEAYELSDVLASKADTARTKSRQRPKSSRISSR
jgi:hypothetical protein